MRSVPIKIPARAVFHCLLWALVLISPLTSANNGLVVTAPTSTLLLLDEPPFPACVAPEQQCGNTCINTDSNLSHCGACDQICSGFCQTGYCYTEGICSGGNAPQTEVCTNGMDDDCDGIIDEPNCV